MTQHILIADDHALYRAGLKQMVAQAFPDHQFYEAKDYDDCRHQLSADSEIELVLIDLNMPASADVDLQTLIASFPLTPFVVLSGSTEIKDIKRAMDAGALGYIPKNEPPQQMVSAIQRVLAGEIYQPDYAQPAPSAPFEEYDSLGLSPRQREVLEMMAQGQTNKDIARKLNLTESTIKSHVTGIFRVLAVSNRTQAVLRLQALENA